MRSDTNQREIVKALRDAGASVTVLAKVGHGCPDLLVGYGGINYLFEVKSEKGKLSESQLTWFANWQGKATVVRTAAQALQVLGLPSPPERKDRFNNKPRGGSNENRN